MFRKIDIQAETEKYLKLLMEWPGRYISVVSAVDPFMDPEIKQQIYVNTTKMLDLMNIRYQRIDGDWSICVGYH